MVRSLIALTLCLCMAVTFAADLRQLTAERAAAAPGSRPHVPLNGLKGVVGAKAGVSTKASNANDQETASSFYGVGFYGPGYGGFYGGPYGGFGGYPFGGFGGYGGFGYPGFFYR